MRTFVESMRRLYKAGRVSDDKLKSMQEAGKITAEEYEYITSE